MELSIIVPVYNVERFLTRCLDSIFSQSFPGELEVIAVDDGSGDGSLAALRSYAANEERLVVLTHGENRKLSVARASGLKVAKGRYVMHVDADDWLLPGALASIFRHMQGEGPDVIMFNYAHADETGGLTVVRDFSSEHLGPLTQELLPHFFKSCWAKVVKRELTEEMVYFEHPLNRGEDLIIGIETFLRAKTALCVPEVWYAYFRNPESITNTGSGQDWFVSRVPVLEAIVALKERYGLDGGAVSAAVRFQMGIIVKKIALYRLGSGAPLVWKQMVAVLDKLDEQGVLSRRIVRSDQSFVSRVTNAYRYLGLRWVTRYAINGVLLSKLGRGWILSDGTR